MATKIPSLGTYSRALWDVNQSRQWYPAPWGDADSALGGNAIAIMACALARMSGSPTLTLNATARTITRSTGSWFADGFVVGDVNRGRVLVYGTSRANEGLAAKASAISAISATVLTLSPGALLRDEGPVAGCASIGLPGTARDATLTPVAIAVINRLASAVSRAAVTSPGETPNHSDWRAHASSIAAEVAEIDGGSVVATSEAALRARITAALELPGLLAGDASLLARLMAAIPNEPAFDNGGGAATIELTAATAEAVRFFLP